MEQVDKKDWEVFKAEVTNKLSQKNFKLLCALHAKYMKHTYYEPCSCRPKQLKQWIKDLDDLYNK